MENMKEINGLLKGNKENPSQETQNVVTDAAAGSNSPTRQQPSRRPFTSLSQVDSDLALARTLQEQERAYLMLRMAGERGENLSSLTGGFVYEDGVDLHENEDVESLEEEEEGDEGDANDEEVQDDDDQDLFDVDPSAFENDEAYARALQEAEEGALAAQMMAFGGIGRWESDEDDDETGNNSQDAQQEIDPDELSYEELLALGEVVGNESKGLTADMIASLPSSNYNPTDSHNGTSEQCVICRFDYEEGDHIVVLPCKHTYHSECITNWLQINKVCPVCNSEISTSTTQRGN